MVNATPRHATPQPAYSGERPGTLCTGGWMFIGAGLDRQEKYRPNGIRSPDRPARSESLYRLRQPARSLWMYQTIQRHIHGIILTTKAVKSKISRINLLPVVVLVRIYGTGGLKIQSWGLPRVSDTRHFSAHCVFENVNV